MMNALYSNNHPRDFWILEPEPSEDQWQLAIRRAFPVLGLEELPEDLEAALSSTLGEAQLGPERWRLSQAKRLYYSLKPLFPRMFCRFVQFLNAKFATKEFPLGWPIEERYAHFQWEIIRQLALETGARWLNFRHFWPGGHRYAFILTHDIESKHGQAFVAAVADLEESMGFRSSFNFVPERYSLDRMLIQDLQHRGFEVGIHGLKHDGKLYGSRSIFSDRAVRINQYLQDFDAVGFRSPFVQRNPEWLQDLQIEYDLSFFDTDPFQPMPGGCMSIWPFFIGHFVELPFTLAQDCTLAAVLGEDTISHWLEKLAFIKEYCGMALLNTHPDYLREDRVWEFYTTFLNTLSESRDYWHALPREAACWWRKRCSTLSGLETTEMVPGTIVIENDCVSINLLEFSLTGQPLRMQH